MLKLFSLILITALNYFCFWDRHNESATLVPIFGLLTQSFLSKIYDISGNTRQASLFEQIMK